MDIEGIRNEAQQIQEFLEITMSDNPQEVIERGNDLQVYMERTGKLLADAKYILNDQKRHKTMDIIRDFIIDQKLSAKVQNAFDRRALQRRTIPCRLDRQIERSLHTST